MQTHIQTTHSGLTVGHSGPVHLNFRFVAPSVGAQERTPAAFVAVIDRSGSMNGGPLEAAKLAALTALRGLRRGDWFGVVSFDDHAQVVVPCAPAGSREVAEARIQAVQAGGCTDLAGGWSLGRDLLRAAPSGLPRRLILLTDGLANRGVVEPQAIQRMCSDSLEADRVRTSALGFGDDYDENLLSALASAGHGEFHDATQTRSLPEIFAKELGSAQQVVVEGLRVRVRLHPHTRSVRRLGGAIPGRLADGRLEFPVGDLIADEEKRVVLECDMDLAGVQEGTHAVLGEIEIAFARVGGGLREEQLHHRRVELPVLGTSASIQVDQDELAWVHLVRAGELVEHALRLCDAGEHQRALSELNARLVELKALQRTPVLEDAIALIEAGCARLGDRVEYRRSRKTMKFMSSQMVAASSKDGTVFEACAMPSFKSRARRRS